MAEKEIKIFRYSKTALNKKTDAEVTMKNRHYFLFCTPIFFQHTLQKYMPKSKGLLYSLNIISTRKNYAAMSDVTQSLSRKRY